MLDAGNNGVAYCQGMYIFHEDPLTAVEDLGIDRIFFCHARNLVRYGPSFREHEEVPLDTGDVDIEHCVHSLMQAGYEGVIIPEHLGGHSSMAEAVSCLRQIIAG